MRWHQDNPKENVARARAIQVGVPLHGSTVLDRETGFGEGNAIPEADRDAHTTPIYHEKKKAIPGIPLVDEDGAEIVESEDDSKSAADHFKQSIYENDLNMDDLNSASKILNKTEPIEMKLGKKMKKVRRSSSKKKKGHFGQAPFEGTLMRPLSGKNQNKIETDDTMIPERSNNVVTALTTIKSPEVMSSQNKHRKIEIEISKSVPEIID